MELSNLKIIDCDYWVWYGWFWVEFENNKELKCYLNKNENVGGKYKPEINSKKMVLCFEPDDNVNRWAIGENEDEDEEKIKQFLIAAARKKGLRVIPNENEPQKITKTEYELAYQFLDYYEKKYCKELVIYSPEKKFWAEVDKNYDNTIVSREKIKCDIFAFLEKEYVNFNRKDVKRIYKMLKLIFKIRSSI